MQLNILYEDNDIVAINKPSGLVVHSDGKTREESVADWVLEHYPETIKIGESTRTPDGKEISRPGVVHRLDRETSGVMLVVKTQTGFDCLKKQFQEHLIKKIYYAFAYGEMPAKINGVIYLDNGKRGVISRSIGRSSSDFRKWSAQRGARGEMREAITEFEVEKRGMGYSFVKIFPKTGRTHQIRVHFKAINYPLVSDPLYVSNKENSLGFNRLALHSYQIEFNDVGGKAHSIIAPYSTDFEKAILLLQK